MKNSPAIILGSFLLVAIICHALLTKHNDKPRVIGFIQGEVWKHEGNGIAKLKCNGFKAELYDNFVLIHVDKSKKPSWTVNHTITLPWNKIEYLTLAE